ncbi:MAG: alpha/beta fold hydrolase, partial [Parvibaculum sp.]
MSMKILRTPDDRFLGLPGYDFAPHYTEIRDEDGTPIRIHHVDEGPRDAPPIVLMHGNPTWAYLYRKMIPGLLKTGRRVIAVDLPGHGFSAPLKASPDLPCFVAWFARLVDELGLEAVNVAGHS